MGYIFGNMERNISGRNKPAFPGGVSYKGFTLLRGTGPSDGHRSEWRREGVRKNQSVIGLYAEVSEKQSLILDGYMRPS